MLKVAVIGGGAAGMGAAHQLLDAGCEVTLFETREHLGGHAFSVDMPGPNGQTLRVDGGVSDYNRAASPTFDRFLDQLGVPRQSVADDASYMTPSGQIVWTTRGKPPPLTWLSEKRQFEREALEVISSPFYDDMTTLRYLDSRGYSDAFRRLYLYPRAAGCFSMPDGYPGHYPIRSLVELWKTYGLVGREAPDRVRVVGGMHRYGDTMARWFVDHGGRLLCSHQVVCGWREHGNIRLTAKGPHETAQHFDFDELVLAVFPHQARDLLADATAAERLLVSLFEFQQIRVVTHQDPELMPADRDDWCASNFLVPPRGESIHKPTLTSYVNRLADLPAGTPDVFVTLNPHREPDPARILDERLLSHPKPGPAARQATRLVSGIQGRRHTWWCGSYLAEPFLHEQAFASGVRVAEGLLATLSKKIQKRCSIRRPHHALFNKPSSRLLPRRGPAF